MSLEALSESIGAVLLGMLAILALAGGVAALIGYRAARRWLRDLRRDWALGSHPDSQKVARLAREIRAGARRLRQGLLPAHGDRQEAQELQRILARFMDRELPESLDRVLSLTALGGKEQETALLRRLEKQQQALAKLDDDAARQRVNREVAVTRQLLDQTRQANRSLTRVTAGLAETARVLRGLEVELAALGAVRASDNISLPGRMAETAEELRHFREAYLSLDTTGE